MGQSMFVLTKHALQKALAEKQRTPTEKRRCWRKIAVRI